MVSCDFTVYPKKYAHDYCFAVFCCGYTLTDFPISIRLTSLALWQSNDCPSASKATLMNMDKYFMWIHYERLHNHNKAKHNKTVCIFLGIYCSCCYEWSFLWDCWRDNTTPTADPNIPRCADTPSYMPQEVLSTCPCTIFPVLLSDLEHKQKYISLNICIYVYIYREYDDNVKKWRPFWKRHTYYRWSNPPYEIPYDIFNKIIFYVIGGVWTFVQVSMLTFTIIKKLSWNISVSKHHDSAYIYIYIYM